MTHYTFPRQFSFFREHRLCHDEASEKAAAQPQNQEPEKKKQENEKAKLDRERKEKRDQIRQKLLDLQAQVKKTQSQTEAKTKTEQVEKSRQSLRETIDEINAMDADSIAFLEQDLGQGSVKRFRELLENQTDTFSQELGKTLSVITVASLTNINTPEDADRFIRNSVLNPLLNSRFAQPLMKQALGLGLTTDQISGFLFGLIRNKVANFLSTSPLISEDSNMAQLGKDMHFRRASESYRNLVARAQRRPISEFPTLESALLAPGVLTPPATPVQVDQRWNELYDIWSANARFKKANNQRLTQGPPTIAYAIKHVQSGAALPRRLDEDLPAPAAAPNTANTAQERVIGNLRFPGSGLIEVQQTAVDITHDSKAITFDKDGNAYRMRVGATDTLRLKLFVAEQDGQEADNVKLRAPVAPSTNTGDVEVVVKKGNGAERSVKLEALVKLIEGDRNSATRKQRIVIAGNNDARLA